ncbi:hypothetical protein OEZ85_014370 [Tetradesmus obliquus]|uniref:Dickkopf N-terminal cysteine-rich domain-containing protein n=1 Tax=Tetradesmus obliquus TaxID=3088 RepID=A0ABY8UAR7_TETOB|nr:hypothetical protein OEZ85_014370 [Tetradesmus obliquus]
MLATEVQGVCLRCQIGEYCPAGSQEESYPSLHNCSEASAAAGSSSSSRATAAYLGMVPGFGDCKGYKPCPEGALCQNPGELAACQPGKWCAQGSFRSEACNITNLLSWNTFRLVRPDPLLLLQSLAMSGQPLDGNTCPANSTTPLQGCAAGYYCESPGRRQLCPENHYCPRLCRRLLLRDTRQAAAVPGEPLLPQ